MLEDLGGCGISATLPLPYQLNIVRVAVVLESHYIYFVVRLNLFPPTDAGNHSSESRFQQ